MSNFLNTEYFMNTGQDWLIAVGILVGSLVILKVIQMIIFGYLSKLAKKTETDLDDLVISLFRRLKPAFYVTISLYIAVQRLVLPETVNNIIDGIFILVLVFYGVFLVQEVLNFGTKKIIEKKENDESADPTAVRTINSLLKMVVWVVAGIMLLSNWGVNVTGLVAGLGIGGLALAFAFQNILEDIFSSFSILIDKPFRVGDFIKVGSEMGVVEKVGIKTTRLRTPQGEQLVMSNRQLTTAEVHNFGRLERRRNLFTVGIIYETPHEKVEAVPMLIQKAVESVENVSFDRAHFCNFGDSSLDFEIVYYAETADYAQYMDLQQSVKLKIKELFDQEGIEFAYPTQVQYNKN